LRNRLNHHPDPDLLSHAKKEWEKNDILEWNFGDLPDRVLITTKDKTRWTLYPGLKIEADHLNLRLFADKNKASDSHKAGVAYLFSKHFSKELKYLKRNLILTDMDDTVFLPYGGRKTMEKMLFECVSKALFQTDIRKKVDYFNQLHQLESAGIHRRGQNLLHATKMVLMTVHDTRSTFRRLESIHHNRKGLLDFINNLEHDLTKLVPVNFLKLYERERLPHIVRYSKGLKIRAERGVLNYDKDRNKEKVVSVFAAKLQHLISELSPQVSKEKRTAVEDLFWLLEEFKISLFAQELKTAIRVSEKILNKAIHEIEHMI
jgi:ATP-dependent helicase HrpA